MRQHYYLVSSLYELFLDAKAPVTLKGFLDQCDDMLLPEELEELKKLFLLRDLGVAVQEFAFPVANRQPVVWTRELLADFLAPFDVPESWLKPSELEFRELGGRPSRLDEILLTVYNRLEEIVAPRTAEWFLFDLDLRNVTTALALRKTKQPFHESIIKVGTAATAVLQSSAVDFGLSLDLPYLPKLVEVYGEKQLHSMERDKQTISGAVPAEPSVIERFIDQIRWDWLTQNWESDTFGTYAVYAYALKLAQVERWNGLNPEEGARLFEKLVNQIKGSIVFSDELFVGKGKR